MSNKVTAFWRKIPDADNDTTSVRVADVTLEDLAQNIERAIKRMEQCLDDLDNAQSMLENERAKFAEECKRRGLFDGLRSELANE